LTKFLNKSFSVGIDNPRYDEIFRKDKMVQNGVMMECEACEIERYCFEVRPEKGIIEFWCLQCIVAEEGIIGKELIKKAKVFD
jgi:hypothetical protein